MKAKELITKVLVGNPKTIVSIFAMMFLICSIQGIGYAAPPEFIEPDANLITADDHDATRSIDENTPANVNIGAAVSAEDPDGDTLAYTLSGADGTSFKIVSTSGQLQTSETADVLDYETKKEYTVMVTVTAGGESVTSTVTITVIDIDEKPVFGTVQTPIEEQTFEISEGDDPNRLVSLGNIQAVPEAVDPDDEDGPVTYALLTKLDGGLFNFNIHTRQLSTKAPLDYDQGRRNYRVDVTATDRGGLVATIEITINVTPVNERPVFAFNNQGAPFADLTELTFEISENTPAGISLNDSDNNNPFYVVDLDLEPGTGDDEDTLVADIVSITTDDAKVTTINDAGVMGDPEGAETLPFEVVYDMRTKTVQLKTSAALNYEGLQAEYTVEITATDDGTGTLTDIIVINITVVDVNEPPVFDLDNDPDTINTITYEIQENTDIFSEVLPEATDPDRDANDDPQELTYTLEDENVRGTDANFFTFDFDTVAERWKLGVKNPLDYETTQFYTVRLIATDDGMIGGSDVGAASGTITITIRVLDEASEPVIPANRKPSFGEGSSTLREVDENMAENEDIGAAVGATDPDTADTLTYRLGGDDVSSFSIDSTTGQLTTSAPLDHETKDSYTVTVSVTDGKDDNGGSDDTVDDTITVTIMVTDLNDEPVFVESGEALLGETNRFIPEGTYAKGHPIDNWVVAMDEDEPTQTLTYSIGNTVSTGGPDWESFSIDSETGELRTSKALIANHEEVRQGQDPEDGYSYRVTVTVTDDGIIDGENVDPAVTTIEVIINVTDVNEPPVFDLATTSATTRQIRENDPQTTVIGTTVPPADAMGTTVKATDPEGDTVVYTLEGRDAPSFIIERKPDPNLNEEWQLRPSASAKLDFETKEKYIVTVKATDMGGVVGDPELSDTIEITINVVDLNEKPMFVSNTSPPVPISEATFSVEENAEELNIAVQAVDPDRGGMPAGRTPLLEWNALAYVFVSDTDDIPFEFVVDPDTGRSSGKFKLKENESLNYDDQNDYELVVGVTDGVGDHDMTTGEAIASTEVDATITVLIEVLPVFDAPVNTSPVFDAPSDSRSVKENTGGGMPIGLPVVATDPDIDDPALEDVLTYSIDTVGDQSFDINSETGQLMTEIGLDHEDEDSYTVTVSVTDGRNSDDSEDASGDPDDTIVITINVIDVNEAPEFAGDLFTDVIVIKENAADTLIGTDRVAGAEDEDEENSALVSNALRYTVIGPDASFFIVDVADDGHWQLKTLEGLNHEADRNGDGIINQADYDYKVMVEVTDDKDAEGNSDLIADDTTPKADDTTPNDDDSFIIIRVMNVNEAPMFDETDPVREVSENKDASAGDVYFGGSVSARDPDLVPDTGSAPPTYGVTEDPGNIEKQELTYTLTHELFGIQENTGVLFLKRVQSGPDDPDTTPPTYDEGKPLDYETENDYKVKVTVRDDENEEGITDNVIDDTITVIIRVLDDPTDNNETSNKEPVFEAPLTTREVAENTAVDGAIGARVTATDPERNTLTYALQPPEDADPPLSDPPLFGIDPGTGQLQVKEALNFENPPVHDTKMDDGTYMVVVEVRDKRNADGNPAPVEGADDTIMVFIKITDVNDPPIFTEGLSIIREIDERTAANRPIGNPLAVLDEDRPDQMLSYELGGPDADTFTSELTAEGFRLKTKEPLDYEDAANPDHSYTVTVTVTDDGSPVEDTTATVTINVININEAVANVAPRFDFRGSIDISVDENEPSITVPEATDPDADPNYGELEYVLVPDDGDAALFTFNSGTRALKFKTLPDYEDTANPDHSYTVTITVTDGRNIDNDPDPSNAKVEDDRITININVTDVNEAPEFPTATDTRDVAENTRAGMPIGEPVAAMDPDGTDADPVTAGAQSLTYSLGDTDDDNSFDVGASGQLQTKEALDFETQSSYTVTITASDGKTDHDATITVTINVMDVNEAPVFPEDTDNTLDVDENTAAGVDIGDPVAAMDPDGTDADPETAGTQSLEYTLDDGTDAAHFAIDDGTGQLMTDGALDFEDATNPDNSYEVTITASDGKTAHDATITVTIGVTNVNEAPVFPEDTDNTLDVDENTAAGVDIGDPVAATDPDGTDADPDTADAQSLTYSLGDTADDDSFAIDAATGQLKTNGELDFETQSEYMVTVTAFDGAIGTPITVTISVTDVNEAPVFDEDEVATRLVPDNTMADMPIGAPVAATDPDDPDGSIGDADPITADAQSLTYSLGGTDAAHFAIDAETGQLMTDGALDHATDPEYMVTVTASDGTLPTSIDVTIEVTDNAAPMFLDDETGTRNVAENTAAGMPIGAPVAAMDPDDPDGTTDADPDTPGVQSLMYTLGETADDDSFEIDGEGQLQTKAALDYEDVANPDHSYEVTVTASDGVFETSIPVTISVTDVNEAPEFLAATATREVAENIAVGDNIGDPVTAMDPEDDTLTYAISSGDTDELFAIDDMGQLTTAKAVPAGTYELMVTVSDGLATDGIADPASDATITVTITVGNTRPMFDSSSVTYSIPSDTPMDSPIGSPVTAMDHESDPLTYAISSGDTDELFAIDDMGQLTTAKAVPVGTYELMVTVSDGKAADGTADPAPDATITVTITVENTAPAFDATAITRSISPDTPMDSPVGSPVTAMDHESDPLTYAISSGDTDELFAIDDMGQLTTAKAVPVGTYELMVTVSDGKAADDTADPAPDAEIMVTITVENTAPAFDATAPITRSISPDTPMDSPVGDPVTAMDRESDTLTYDISSGDTDELFAIDDMGQLTTAKAVPAGTYELMVTVSDGKAADGTADPAPDAEIMVTIEVTANRAPAFASAAATRSIPEDTAVGGNVGAAVTATDADNDDLMYSLDATSDASFSIDSEGQLTTDVALDAATQNSYTVMVSVTDNKNEAGGSDDTSDATITVTVTVTPVDETQNRAPAFANATTTRSIPEDTAVGGNVGAAVTATDADNDDLMYSLDATSDASFSIDSEGQLTTDVSASPITKMPLATQTARMTPKSRSPSPSPT